jgi:S-adenosylmethionine decarboxylase
MAASPPERDVAALPAIPAPAGAVSTRGAEWIIDARGCRPDVLRDAARLRALFDRLIDALRLTPVAPAVWHTFPAPGGLTGFVILAESHLACHTFPEFGSICVNVFCCRARDDFDAAALMSEMLGADDTLVRRVERAYGPSAVSGTPDDLAAAERTAGAVQG